MEIDQWPSSGTLGHTMHYPEVLHAAGMSPRKLGDAFRVVGSSKPLEAMEIVIYNSVRAFIELMPDLYEGERTKFPNQSEEFRAEVRAIMATIANVANGKVRSALRDEVVFVVFIKMVDSAFPGAFADPSFAHLNLTKLHELVGLQIRKLFSRKILGPALILHPGLPDMDRQEELYQLLDERVRQVHRNYKAI